MGVTGTMRGLGRFVLRLAVTGGSVEHAARLGVHVDNFTNVETTVNAELLAAKTVRFSNAMSL